MGFRDKDFIGFRSEQLALVHLTRHPDLVVRSGSSVGGHDSGVDLTVSVLCNGREGGRLFGVQVKGVLSTSHVETMAKNQSSSANGLLVDIPFPICLIVFAMQGDQGFWTWLKKPATASRPAELLIATGRMQFDRLTNEAVDQIVDQVNAWYDGRLVSVAA